MGADSVQLLHAREILTPADHQTHRRFVFEVPPECRELQMQVDYEPKHLSKSESTQLAETALVKQAAQLAGRVGPDLAARWSADVGQWAESGRLANLLTVSLDDAASRYRGAGHCHAHYQRLVLGLESASPGLVAGPLPAGAWTLTISAHTLVSAQCELSIQIGAEIASSR
ncbi:MAG: hypothetical protein ACR2IK_04810 [Chloroflexota bacterium]